MQLVFILLGLLSLASAETLVFNDEFTTLNMRQWKHEITLGGGGNW